MTAPTPEAGANCERRVCKLRGYHDAGCDALTPPPSPVDGVPGMYRVLHDHRRRIAHEAEKVDQEALREEVKAYWPPDAPGMEPLIEDLSALLDRLTTEAEARGRREALEEAAQNAGFEVIAEWLRDLQEPRT